MEEIEDQIVEMRKQGASYKEIKKALGIREALVAKVLREKGMTNNQEINKVIEERKKQENDKRDNGIIQMKKSGATYIEIMEEYNIGIETIRKILNKERQDKIEKAPEERQEEKRKQQEERDRRDKRIVEMRKSGKTIKQIAEEINVSQETARKIINRNIDDKEIEQAKIDRNAKILEMRENGDAYKKIAEEFAISQETVRRILNDNGGISTEEVRKLRKYKKQKEQEVKKERIQKRNAKILEMRKSGKTHNQIAEELDTSISTVTKVLKENNMVSTKEQIQERKENKRKEKEIKERKQQEEKRDKQIVEMRRSGLTYQQIAQELDTSTSTVSKVLQEQGITNNNEIRQAKKMKKEELERVSGFNNVVAESQKTNGKKIKKHVKDYSQSEISSIIRRIYDEKKKVDIKQLNMQVDLNYDKIRFEDIQLVVRICTRQGEISQAIRIINTLIYTQEYINIDKEKLKELLNALKNHEKKIMIIRRLKTNQSTSKIAFEMGIPETQIIKIKRQWEENKAKKMGAPSSKNPNIGIGIGEK